MPMMENPDVCLHYQVEGKENGPWLVLSNSLGTTLDMWLPQIPTLLEEFRVLRYDTRGHGKSSVPAGPYSVDQLGGDVIALMDHLHIEKAHFCGLSMGGVTGIWLAVNHAHRLDRLALCNTAAQIGTEETWNDRIEKVRKEGMAAVAPAVVDRWFTVDFRRYASAQVEMVREMILSTPPEGYIACCEAIRDMDQRADLSRIHVPTLVVGGRYDLSTPTINVRFLASNIDSCRYIELNTAHMSNWEVAQSFTQHLANFLRG